ncbi:MAG: alpha-amylase family protein [Pseudoclavibacter sp.]|nr:alpha-amylase family protein [Pseudoclavibacter sp.]
MGDGTEGRPWPRDLDARVTFELRLNRYGPEIVENLRAVYGERAEDVYERLTKLLVVAAQERPRELRRLDEARLLSPDWLQQPEMIGYIAYADRFAGTLRDVGERLDHLTGLGVRYLHLMPLLEPRPGENDGGYAVADYRRVRSDLGDMTELAELTAKLRRRGISLVVDLVLNHVAREHEWARRARSGERRYQDYFHVFADREQPDAYERSLPEVFPDFAPGNFSWDEELHGWVWTTFNEYQWDLDWSNPEVLLEFVDIILFLANRGVEVLRLDAIAFLWKRVGTNCQNQPEVHHLTRVLRAAGRVVAPALAFKAEAIVGPTELIHYLGTGAHHGQISEMAYHNSLMVQLWSTLASRDTRLLERALSGFPAKPANTAWATYVRCHDDIGWAIDDADAAAVGLDGPSHRAFLSDFYAGLFPGSFARGLVFQHNPATGDRRISGSAASLAGLETALEQRDPGLVDAAIGRILLLHAVIMGFGGVPLIYMGDEIGMRNASDYADEPAHADDNRWTHRPRMDWDAVRRAEEEPRSPAGRILHGLRRLVEVRARTPHLHASVESAVIPSPDPALLLLERRHPLGLMVQLYNFGDGPVRLRSETLRSRFGDGAVELLSGEDYSFLPESFDVPAHAALWFAAGSAAAPGRPDGPVSPAAGPRILA